MSGLIRALDAIVQKNDDLFAIELDGIEIIFRLPSIKSARQYAILLNLAQYNSEKSIIYETIFRNVVQDDWLVNQCGDLKAGIPETIANLIMRLSGLDDSATEYTEELFRVYRNQSSSDLIFMKRIICSAFGGYTFESLDHLNYQNLVNIFIQAENILLERGIIETEYNFVTPEEVKEAPFKVEDIIRRDKESFIAYDSPEQEDPRKAAYMQKIREIAIQRAKDEEQKFKKKFIQQK